MKQVSFGDLTIREYPIELGDHPSVSSGAPSQIGWTPLSSTTRNLELYEYCKANSDSSPRKASRIPVEKRGLLLIQAGYSLEEIGNAAMEADLHKKLRAETLQHIGWGDRVSILLETTGKIPYGVLLGAGETLKRAQSLPKDILESTGRAINTMIVKPVRKTVQARSA